MANLEESKEMFDWMVRNFPIQDNKETRADWYRIYKPLSRQEMDLGKQGLIQHHNNTYKPTPGVFLGYTGAVRRKFSPSLTHNPSKYWTDDKGRFFADPTQKMKVASGQSTPEGERRAREKFFEKRRDFAGEFDTPLYKINKMLKGQGRRTFKSQQEWDAYKESAKTREGHA